MTTILCSELLLWCQLQCCRNVSVSTAQVFIVLSCFGTDIVARFIVTPAGTEMLIGDVNFSKLFAYTFAAGRVLISILATEWLLPLTSGWPVLDMRLIEEC